MLLFCLLNLAVVAEKLNGSGWYEIVTDPGLRFAQVLGHQDDAQDLKVFLNFHFQ